MKKPPNWPERLARHALTDAGATNRWYLYKAVKATAVAIRIAYSMGLRDGAIQEAASIISIARVRNDRRNSTKVAKKGHRSPLALYNDLRPQPNNNSPSSGEVSSNDNE